VYADSLATPKLTQPDANVGRALSNLSEFEIRCGAILLYKGEDLRSVNSVLRNRYKGRRKIYWDEKAPAVQENLKLGPVEYVSYDREKQIGVFKFRDKPASLYRVAFIAEQGEYVITRLDNDAKPKSETLPNRPKITLDSNSLVGRLSSNGDINYWDSAIAAVAQADPKSVTVKVLLERGENRLKVLRLNIPSVLFLKTNKDILAQYVSTAIYNTVVCEGATNIALFVDNKNTEKLLVGMIKADIDKRYARMPIYSNFGKPITISDSSDVAFTMDKELSPRLDLTDGAFKNKYYLGVDVGGTNIKTVVMYGDKVVYKDWTPVDKTGGGASLKDQIIECSKKASLWLGRESSKKVESIGLTFPSPIEIRRDGSFKVIRLTNFERFWAKARGGRTDFTGDYNALNSIADTIRTELDIQNIAVLNDADAFGFGEIYNRIRQGVDPRTIGTKIVLPIGTGPGYVKIKDGYIENIPNQGGHMVIDMSSDANKDPGCEVAGCYGGYVPKSAFEAMANKHGISKNELESLEPSIMQKTFEVESDIAGKIAAEAVALYKITQANEIVLAGGVSQQATGPRLAELANGIIKQKYPEYADKIKVTVTSSDPDLGGAVGAARYAIARGESLRGVNKPHWSMKYDLPVTTIGNNAAQRFFDESKDGNVRLLISKEAFTLMMSKKYAWLEKLVNENKIIFIDGYKTPDDLFAELSRMDFSTLAALGGGTLTDWAKYCAKKLKKEAVSIPSTLSTNGMFTEKAIFYKGVGGERNRISEEPGPMGRVVIDLGILRDMLSLRSATGISGDRANRAGSGDLISIYPALKDWELAAKDGKEDVDDVIFAAGQDILKLTSENAGDIRDNTDLGMIVLSEAMLEASLLNMRYGVSRPKDGSEHLLADRIEALMPADTPRLHCEIVGIASMIIGYLYSTEYDPHAFFDIKNMLESLGLPTDPAKLGLTKDVIVDALTSIKRRPDKYTFFDTPDGQITREWAAVIYERVFGSQQDEIDKFKFGLSYYVNNSIKAMYQHINEQVIPNLDADKTKELLDLLLETKRHGGRVIINAAGRVGEVAVFFQQKLRALGFQVDDFKEITPEFLVNENDLVLTFSGSGSTSSVVNNLKNVDMLHREKKLNKRIFSITATPDAPIWKTGPSYHSVMVIKGRTKDIASSVKKDPAAEYLPLSSTFEYSTMLYLEGIIEALIQGGANGLNKDEAAKIVRGVIGKTPSTIKDELKEKIMENEPLTGQFIDYLLSAVERNSDGTIKKGDNDKTYSKKGIFLFGLGQNNYVIRLFARRIQNIGFEVQVPGPRDIISAPHKGDIAIFISNSGARGQMEEKMLVAKEKECPTIFITAAPHSPMAAKADLVIPISRRPTVSHTVDIMENNSDCQAERDVKRTFELASMFYLEGVSVALMKVLGVTDKDLQHVPKEWELKGPKAPQSNPLIGDIIKSGGMVEFALEEGVMRGYQVNYVNGYKPGITDPNEYRGPPVNVTDNLTKDEIATLKEWIQTHQIDDKLVKFRVALGKTALGWNNDIDHSNIAHAGENDRVIYIGEGLLKHILARGNESLREEVLDKDEFQHLQGRGHGTDAEYRTRLDLVARQSIFAEQTSAPLIGRGFNSSELNNAPITHWEDNPIFVETIKSLEQTIREKAPREIRASLLIALRRYKEGIDGRQLGISPERYESTDRYYLGFGTSKSIGASPLFFTEGSSFYKHREEALCHELFHAMRQRRDDVEDAKTAAVTHVDAMRLTALLYWNLTDAEKLKIPYLDPRDLKNHSKNEFGKAVREWRLEQSKLAEKMALDDWKSLLVDLKSAIKISNKRRANTLFEFLEACDNSASAGDNAKYPIESRYPLLRAVMLLDKAEQDKLVDILKSNLAKRRNIRALPMVDSILLLLDEELPDNWLETQAPYLAGRSIWQASSEIWYAAGGLGRVMQFHGKAMKEILKKFNIKLRHIEPMYSKRPDPQNRNAWINLDYHSDVLSYPVIGELEVVERFPVTYGDLNHPRTTEAIVYRGYNELGIEVYLIKDRDDFVTGSIYRYGDGVTLPTWEQFTSFMSAATLELVRRVETKERAEHPDTWKAPILHNNDSQLSLTSLDRIRDDTFFMDGNGQRMRYCDDEVSKSIIMPGTTHTYKNRQEGSGEYGKRMLERGGVPSKYWNYAERDFNNVYDYASCLLRTSDWQGGVSRKHVQDVTVKDYWWPEMNIVAVTNGDDRPMTGVVFRKIMKELYPDIDVEHPTPEQFLTTKKKSKESFTLKQNPANNRYYSTSSSDEQQIRLNSEQTVWSYTGRLVPEKAGRNRALCDENIEEMVTNGAQIIIAGNVQSYDDSIQLERDLIALVARLRSKPGVTGRLIFIPYFNINEQRDIFAATDFGILDSDPNTEAAGGSETHFAVTGGLIIAPPWPNGEGILVDQGIPINLEVAGEGNTFIPDVNVTQDMLRKILRAEKEKDNPELNKVLDILRKAYLAEMRKGLAMSAQVRAVYQLSAIAISRVPVNRLTAAEYLRQWSMAAAKKEGLGIYNKSAMIQDAQPALAGSIKNGLETLLGMNEFFTKGVTFEDFENARLSKHDMHRTTAQVELNELEKLGLVVVDRSEKAYRYLARSELRGLAAAEIDIVKRELLAIAQLGRRQINDSDERAGVRNTVEKIIQKNVISRISAKTRKFLLEDFINDESNLFTENNTKIILKDLYQDVFKTNPKTTVADLIDYILSNPRDFAKRFSADKSWNLAKRSPREDVLFGLRFYLGAYYNDFFSSLLKIREFRAILPTNTLVRFVSNFNWSRAGWIRRLQVHPTIFAILDRLEKAAYFGEGYSILSDGDNETRNAIMGLLVWYAPEYVPLSMLKGNEAVQREALRKLMLSGVIAKDASFEFDTASGYLEGLKPLISKDFKTLNILPEDVAQKVGEAVRDVKAGTDEMADYIHRQGEGLDLSHNFIIMRKGLVESAVGVKALPEPVRERLAKIVKQGVSGLNGKEIIEVGTREELISAMNDIIGKDKEARIAVLDDDILTGGMDPREGIAGVKGQAGTNYCAITTGMIQGLDKTTIPFINIQAMALMGVGVLYEKMSLFEMAYNLFTGHEMPPDLVSDLAGRIKWLVKALPRIIKFTDEISSLERLKKLFEVSA
jgi:glycerol dehydrogenase-like iron-containing ADH family enzyme/D-arabinose 5-phosphate isomerase GutQ/predicted NBD/HSP70 family sugar kinase